MRCARRDRTPERARGARPAARISSSRTRARAAAAASACRAAAAAAASASRRRAEIAAAASGVWESAESRRAIESRLARWAAAIRLAESTSSFAWAAPTLTIRLSSTNSIAPEPSRSSEAKRRCACASLYRSPIESRSPTSSPSSIVPDWSVSCLVNIPSSDSDPDASAARSTRSAPSAASASSAAAAARASPAAAARAARRRRATRARAPPFELRRRLLPRRRRRAPRDARAATSFVAAAACSAARG